MAAKMAVGTYNFITNSARRLLLVSRLKWLKGDQRRQQLVLNLLRLKSDQTRLQLVLNLPWLKSDQMRQQLVLNLSTDLNYCQLSLVTRSVECWLWETSTEFSSQLIVTDITNLSNFSLSFQRVVSQWSSTFTSPPCFVVTLMSQQWLTDIRLFVRLSQQQLKSNKDFKSHHHHLLLKNREKLPRSRDK